MTKRLVVILIGLLFSPMLLALVNINTASYEELLKVKGIGPKKAQAIIIYRNTYGKFHSVEDLAKIKGFNQATISKVAPQIKIN